MRYFPILLVILGLLTRTFEAGSIDTDSDRKQPGIFDFFGGVFKGVGSLVKGFGEGIKRVITGNDKHEESTPPSPVNENQKETTAPAVEQDVSSNSVETATSSTKATGSVFGITLPFGSIFGAQKSKELRLKPFISGGLLDENGNVVGRLASPLGEITEAAQKLANHLEDSLTISQVNVLLNKKICQQESMAQFSSFLHSDKFFFNRTNLQSEEASQSFYAALDGKVEIQHLRRILAELFTCPSNLNIDNCADKSGALIILANVVDRLENSLDHPQQLLNLLKRKLQGDEKLRTAIDWINKERVRSALKEVFKSDTYQKMIRSLKDSGNGSSFVISTLLDFSNPLQTVLLLF